MHIGPLELADASPLSSCVNGGRKIMIVSDQTLPKDVEPIFQIWSEETQMKDLEKCLTQPYYFQVRNESIILLTPPQGNLNGVNWNNLTLKLAVRRIEDNHISNNKFTFKYVPHDNLNCMYCYHSLDTEGLVCLVENKNRGKRSMSVKNYSNRDVKKATDECSLNTDAQNKVYDSQERKNVLSSEDAFSANPLLSLFPVSETFGSTHIQYNHYIFKGIYVI